MEGRQKGKTEMEGLCEQGFGVIGCGLGKKGEMEVWELHDSNLGEY